MLDEINNEIGECKQDFEEIQLNEDILDSKKDTWKRNINSMWERNEVPYYLKKDT